MRSTLFSLLTLASLASGLHAQSVPTSTTIPGAAVLPPSTLGYEAIIERKGGNLSTERITTADANGISLLTSDGRGVIRLANDQIQSVRFTSPPEWPEILQLIKQGKVAEVEAKMKPVAMRMAPMTVVKNGDASKFIYGYTDVLRSLGKYSQAVDFFDKTPFPADAPVAERARRLIVKSYCLAMLGKVAEAEAMLSQVQAPGDKSSLFAIYLLARSRVYSEKKDYISALDDISHIIAVKRLGSESYDEALFQSGEAYEALKNALIKQKEAVKADDRLARQMEQDNIEAIGRFEIIKSDPLQVAALWDADYSYDKCATSARVQLSRVYPSSPWTAKARQKLPPEVVKMLDEEAGRDAVAKAEKQVGASTAAEEKADETQRKDRTGRNDAPAKATSTGTPAPEQLKLDESTNEKDP